MSLPTKQNAAVKQGTGPSATAALKKVPVPSPGPGQILVKINWTGFCGSDNALIHDGWKESSGVVMQDSTKGIAGHEGAGVVVAVHPGVADFWKIGDRAGVKWVASVCRNCEFCTNGQDELQCAKQLDSAVNTPGTFQEYCLTDRFDALSGAVGSGWGLNG
jgi:alcohol dehydrogenase, propanol-preferring